MWPDSVGQGFEHRAQSLKLKPLHKVPLTTLCGTDSFSYVDWLFLVNFLANCLFMPLIFLLT